MPVLPGHVPGQVEPAAFRMPALWARLRHSQAGNTSAWLDSIAADGLGASAQSGDTPVPQAGRVAGSSTGREQQRAPAAKRCHRQHSPADGSCPDETGTPPKAKAGSAAAGLDRPGDGHPGLVDVSTRGDGAKRAGGGGNGDKHRGDQHGSSRVGLPDPIGHGQSNTDRNSYTGGKRHPYGKCHAPTGAPAAGHGLAGHPGASGGRFACHPNTGGRQLRSHADSFTAHADCHGTGAPGNGHAKGRQRHGAGGRPGRSLRGKERGGLTRSAADHQAKYCKNQQPGGEQPWQGGDGKCNEPIHKCLKAPHQAAQGQAGGLGRVPA
jgi:hypothetical protein